MQNYLHKVTKSQIGKKTFKILNHIFLLKDAIWYCIKISEKLKNL